MVIVLKKKVINKFTDESKFKKSINFVIGIARDKVNIQMQPLDVIGETIVKSAIQMPCWKQQSHLVSM